MTFHRERIRLRYGLVVRIAGSHPAGPGSIPGNGNLLFCLVDMKLPRMSELLYTHYDYVYNHWCAYHLLTITLKKNHSTRMGFEPTRAEPIGLAVQRLNHSATSSCPGFGENPVDIL